MVLVAETLPDGDESTVMLPQEQRDTWLNTDLTEPQAKRDSPTSESLTVCVLHLAEKGEGPEHPYGVVDRSYANFRE